VVNLYYLLCTDPSVRDRSITDLSTVTDTEVKKIGLLTMPLSKQCQLDPATTWLIKPAPIRLPINPSPTSDVVKAHRESHQCQAIRFRTRQQTSTTCTSSLPVCLPTRQIQFHGDSTVVMHIYNNRIAIAERGHINVLIYFSTSPQALTLSTILPSRMFSVEDFCRLAVYHWCR